MFKNNSAYKPDASYRFERGIDSNNQLTAAYRAAELISEMVPDARVTETIDQHPLPKQPLELSLRVSRVHQILGVKIGEEWILDHLNKLEITSKPSGPGMIMCQIPSFRPDIEREIDLVEEIGRLYDYNNIPSPTGGIQLSLKTILRLGIRQTKNHSDASWSWF